MLACDSGLHRFTASTDSFARHFRVESYPEQRERRIYSAMYTEGEPKEKLRKLENMSPSHSSPALQSATHGCEAPPQLSPEVLPPASAAHTTPRSSSSQPDSPVLKPVVSTSLTMSSYQPALQPSDGKSEHRQHAHNLSSKDSDIVDLHLERGHNSDSDSSINGMTDACRRYREFVPEEQKDEVYWEKRRKNNEAARKSREKRRMHDMVLEGRINCLEDDNTKLRRELLALKKKFNLPDSQTFHDRDMDAKESVVHGAGSNSSPSVANHIQASMHNSPIGGVCKQSNNIPYSSPPPLLAMAEAVPMGVAMYSGSSKTGMPYLLSETSRMNTEGTIKTMPSSVAPGHHFQQHVSSQHLHHSMYPADFIKDEPIEVGEVRVRSNSSVERRPNYHLDQSEASFLRRGSVGSYSQYRPPLSPPIAQLNHPFSNSPSHHAHYLSRSYDGHPMSLWSQRSPLSSHSSDDTYDEPLQLTVRRDSSVSVHSSNHMDDSSREEDSSAAPGEKASVSVSPPASSFPLKLRHKLPSHDLAYPKEMFPTISPVSVSVTQPSFPTHPFMNGMTHLPDLALSQTNPISMVKVESHSPYTQRKDVRIGSRRSQADTKYLDPKYLERRRRNNEAARKCRENRKTLTKIREAKSDYLETENSKLRDELTGLQEEMKQLRELIEKKRLEQGIKEEPNVES